MSDATTPTKGPSTADSEVLTDIHTQSNLAEVEIVSLVQELIPRYRLRADTDFACSNQDFIQTPRIDGTEFQGLTNTQIQALLDYYASSSNRISQMTKTYHDITAVTRMLEERENDLQIAVTLGHTLLESNETLRSQVTLLEQDIEQTAEIVKQLKHDLLLKERLLRFYSDLEESDLQSADTINIDVRHYEQKIRNLETENEKLRAETLQLKLDSETYEHQEQATIEHLAHEIADAHAEIDNLQQELLKKNEENTKQQNEIVRLSYDMKEIRRRLSDLKKENEEIKHLLSASGKNRDEYEKKIYDLEKNYSECLDKLHKSQVEINTLQNKLLLTSPSSSMSDLSPSRHTVFLSPVEYANYMGIENSLKSELEEVLEDPNQLCHSTINANEQTVLIKKGFRRRLKRDPSDTDGESTVNDSAFSDTESISGVSSCPHCQRCASLPKSETKSSPTYPIERRVPSGISSKLRLVKRFEGSNMLKRWQELAEPSLSSCLQSIPGVYTRAEILHGINEDDEEYSSKLNTIGDTSIPRLNLIDLLNEQDISDLKRNSFAPDPDETDNVGTPPSSPTHVTSVQTSVLLQQVIQRLVGMSLRTFETLTSKLNSNYDQHFNDDDEIKEINFNQAKQRLCTTPTITPPSSPTFDGLAVPTPNTAMRAIKSSTFLRVSSLNPLTKAFAIRSPGEIPSIINEFFRN